MGIFDKIFKKNIEENPSQGSSIEVVSKTKGERIVFFHDSNNNITKSKVILGNIGIDIPGIDFHCHFYVKSEDDNFILAYNDEFFINIDGNRKRIQGELVFINTNRLFYVNFIERPNDGKLASNGNFVINDWMAGGNLNGIFYAFNSEAEVLIKRKFNSNLGNNGISESGHYAIVETLISDSNDQNKIFFFNLDNGKLLWERERDAGNIKIFEFDEPENVILISYEKGGKYRYSFKGEFLDKYKFMEERVTYANGYELFDIAKEKMDDLNYKTSNLPDYEEVLSFLVKASNKGVTPYTKARIHRVIGEIYYNYGKTDEALKNFEIALNNDPKVGVKQLYSKLKKDSR